MRAFSDSGTPTSAQKFSQVGLLVLLLAAVVVLIFRPAAAFRD